MQAAGIGSAVMMAAACGTRTPRSTASDSGAQEVPAGPSPTSRPTASRAMARIDPELVDNPFIFPTEADLARVSEFKFLDPAQQVTYTQAFQTLIGN